MSLSGSASWSIDGASSERWRAEKKTPGESVDPPPVDPLVEGYERLRESVLEDDRFEATRRGLSVFLNQGMAAWMKVYQLLDEPHSEPNRVSFVSTPRELASDIAELMAEVFLRRKEEESRC